MHAIDNFRTTLVNSLGHLRPRKQIVPEIKDSVMMRINYYDLVFAEDIVVEAQCAYGLHVVHLRTPPTCYGCVTEAAIAMRLVCALSGPTFIH
jgi:hypothetical protein